MYNNDGSDRTSNGTLIYKDQEANIARIQKSKYDRQMRAYQRQQQLAQMHERYGNYYVPGSNGAAATYGSGSSGQMNYNSRGAATYGNYSQATRF
jgi:hypothetical protein